MTQVITLLDICEEFRFVLELLGAECIFIGTFARRRTVWLPQMALGLAALLALSQLYHFWPKGSLVDNLPGLDMCFYNLSWYSALTLLSLVYMWSMFHIHLCDLLFLGVMSYAAQHMVYAVCNELLAMALFPALPSHLPAYLLLCAGCCIPIYWGIWRVTARPLRGLDGVLFGENRGLMLFYLALLLVFTGACFAQQHFFWFAPSHFRVLIVLLDSFVCLLMLMVLYAVCSNSLLFRSRLMMDRLLQERRNQYELSRDTIALLNQKYHDLKHQIQALRTLSGQEQGAFLDEVEASILGYDTLYHTGNEALNTILTEKQRCCEQNQIQLTCIADGAALQFLHALDLYTLLGNALDNAIQCVSQYDAAHRLITLDIRTQGGFALIRLTNYFTGKLVMKDGIPQTTKADARYHGFGIRGMQSIVEKYRGVLELGQEGEMFVLTAMFPRNTSQGAPVRGQGEHPPAGTERSGTASR